MELIQLIRKTTSDNGTFGELWWGDKFLCYTCELPWKDNQRKISCIPKGFYLTTRFLSPSNGRVFLLNDVPERDMVQIHAGNTIKDILGCILAGSAMGEVDGLPAVINSRVTMLKLREELPEKFDLQIMGICG